MEAKQQVQEQTQPQFKYINSDMTVGDIVKNYPEVVGPLSDMGIHCVGCHAATWEKIGDGFAGHGMTPEQVSQSLQKLNSVIEEKQNTPMVEGTISITDKAVEKAKEFMIAENKPNAHLRFQVLAGGCSGSTYDLHFTDVINASDIIIEKNGLKVLVAPASLEQAAGATIDFVDSLQGSGFKIENPEAKSGCGCGKSFN